MILILREKDRKFLSRTRGLKICRENRVYYDIRKSKSKYEPSLLIFADPLPWNDLCEWFSTLIGLLLFDKNPDMVCQTLSKQQRMDITTASQFLLRQMSFMVRPDTIQKISKKFTFFFSENSWDAGHWENREIKKIRGDPRTLLNRWRPYPLNCFT